MSGDRSVTVCKPSVHDDAMVAFWILVGLAVWLGVATVEAMLFGSMIRLADRREGVREDVVQAEELAQSAPVVARVAAPRRRSVPLPPVGVALVLLATALMVSGYVVRLSGSTGPVSQLLSMDAPFSLPRMFVAAMFGAAALAALAGAGRNPGRRTWWTAVGLVAGGIAVVKAGSSVHTGALSALEGAIGVAGGLAVSVLVAVSVLGVLAFLSRTEQRDRRRVLGMLTLYGVASVGLSAVSSVAARAYGGGSTWAAAATFVEETGEALAGVSFLIAVLVGVAPRLVLPAAWVLRREADAHSLELPEQRPGHITVEGAG